MHLAPNVFDVWAFQRRAEGVVFLLLYTSMEKATRYFNGGRFWQIRPSSEIHLRGRARVSDLQQTLC